ncbi:MAG TPA: guanylate kinase [Beijerinckiaceae bacterium]|nr:guanylate kinase [Beijerinckiaceae bacterium]
MAQAPASANDTVSRRGLVLILSSPSGAGKTTLTRNIVREHEALLSVSVTTRPRRPSEIDGVHYRFIDKEDFLAMRDRGDLLEWAEVHSNYYGTPRRPVEQALAAGADMIFDIDWQGTRQVVKAMPDDVVTVFILPPSMAELQTRLERRAEDPPEAIAKRLENARSEIERWQEYDYVLVNEDLDRAFNDLTAILRAERLKRQRRVGLETFVGELLKGSA